MITIITGKMNAGKSSLLECLLEHSGALPVTQYTTRPIREEEQSHLAYQYISQEEYDQKIKDEKIFISYATTTLINDRPELNRWGTPFMEYHIQRNYALQMGYTPMLEHLENYNPKYCRIIWMDTDDEVRQERAEKRSDFCLPEWIRRSAADTKEFSEDNMQKICKKYGIPVFRIRTDNKTDMNEVVSFLDRIAEIKEIMEMPCMYMSDYTILSDPDPDPDGYLTIDGVPVVTIYPKTPV